MKLDVLRVPAQKIPSLLKVLCKGGLARYGSVTKTIIAMNERINHFGRLIMASLVALGFVYGAPLRPPLCRSNLRAYYLRGRVAPGPFTR